MVEKFKVYKISHPEFKIPTTWEISNFGRIKRNGELFCPNKNIKGYLSFGGNMLHKAVAELFIPNPDNKSEIDHINGDKFDNRAENLRWVTHKENLNNPISKKRNSDAKKQYYENRPELKKQLSDIHKQRYIDHPELRQLVSERFKGTHISEERKQKLSELNKGENNAMYGKKLKDYMTEEAYQQWIDNHKGKIISEDTRKILSIKNSGENNAMYGKNVKDYMTEEAYNSMIQKRKESLSDRKWISKDGKKKLVKKELLDDYIKQGWVIGIKI